MVKILTLFLSFFSFINYNNDINSNESDSYELIQNSTYDNYSDPENSCINIIYLEDGIILKKTDNSYLLIINGKEIVLKGEKLVCKKVLEKIYVFRYIKEEVKKEEKIDYVYYMEYLVYDLNGEKLEQQSFYNGQITGEVLALSSEEYVFCFFTSIDSSIDTNIECYIFNKRDERKSFGGKLKEELIDVKLDDKYIYLLLKKDSLSGGDFGNAGTKEALVCAKIDYSLFIVDYICFDIVDNELLDNMYFDLNEKNIFIYFDKTLYLLNKDLILINNCILSNDENNLLHIKAGMNNKVLVFYQDKYQVLDSTNLNIEKEVVNDYQKYLFKNLSNSIYAVNQKDNKIMFYYIDLISYEKSKLPKINNLYNQTRLNDLLMDVKSLFGNCTIVNEEYLEYFNNNVFGDYHLNLDYKTKGGITFIRNIVMSVEEKINVYDKMIYPKGYRINFNGEGYLDGSRVYSNEAINSIGEHILVVKGANKTKTINFTISDEQYNFSDVLDRTSDLELKINEDYNIKYEMKLENQKDITNTEIIITNIYCFDSLEDTTLEIVKYDLIKNKDNVYTLNIVFKGYQESGIKIIYLEKIEYKYKDSINVNDFYLNDWIKINVYNDLLVINDTIFNENLGFSFDFYDSLKQARLIRIKVNNNQYNYEFNFPIGNSTINLNGVNEGKYKVFIIFVYDNNLLDLVEKELYSMDVSFNNDNLNVGKIKLNDLNDNGNEINIEIENDFKKNNLSKITNLNDFNDEVKINKEIYVKESKLDNKVIYFVVSFGFSIALGCLLAFLKEKNYFKNLNKKKRSK